MVLVRVLARELTGGSTVEDGGRYTWRRVRRGIGGRGVFGVNLGVMWGEFRVFGCGVRRGVWRVLL